MKSQKSYQTSGTRNCFDGLEGSESILVIQKQATINVQIPQTLYNIDDTGIPNAIQTCIKDVNIIINYTNDNSIDYTKVGQIYIALQNAKGYRNSNSQTTEIVAVCICMQNRGLNDLTKVYCLLDRQIFNLYANDKTIQLQLMYKEETTQQLKIIPNTYYDFTIVLQLYKDSDII